MSFTSHTKKITGYLFILIAFTSCQNQNIEADLILSNARIWTGNSSQPYAEALVVKGDSILFVGSSLEALTYEGKNTVVQNLKGMFITPGFIDTHVHFIGGGFNLSSVQLRDAKSPEEFIARIAAFAKIQKPGDWILGGEWDGKEWGSLPAKEWIDSVTTENPVFVMRLDGHMGLANSLALKLAGVDSKTKDVDGGSVDRTLAGKLTGILRDNAMNLIFDKLPQPSPEVIDNALRAAMKYVSSNGVTSVHQVWDPSDSEGFVEAIERAMKNDDLITRIYTMESLKDWKKLKDRIDRVGKGNHWFKMDGVKGFVDGALGSHTAAFMEPFTDTPKDSGFFINTEAELTEWIEQADAAGIQLSVHAIGDRAINFLLNTYEQTIEKNGPRDRRMRIEHVQHLTPTDIPRFTELNVIASMQPYHAIDDGRWADQYIGPERIKTTYAFKSLFNANATVAFGSDWPVAPATPLEGIYAAVTRRTLDDKNLGGWVPEQKITVEQALLAYTKNGAYASFEEDIKGTLEPGKLADFVILNEDLTKIDPVKIREAKVLQTYVGGKKVYDRSSE